MAGTVTDETKITIIDDDTSAPINIVQSQQFSFTAFEDKRFAITSGQTKTLWDPTTDASEAVSDFDLLIAIADGNLDLEMTCNEGNANEQIGVVRLTDQLPFMLGADDSYFGATQGVTGTLDVIDKLVVLEPSTAAKKLRLLMFT